MKNDNHDPKMTPMMKQYFSIKRNHPDEILFFRLGDFYEMFLEDAKTASKILDIALTSRQDDVPMCGIPYHAAESYIARLIKAGLRVAVCEQMEAVPSNGTIVKREVTRIITPGTIVESNLLQSDDNNFLASIVFSKDRIGLAFVDISTGDFIISSIDKSINVFRGEIAKYNPREALINTKDDPDYSLFIRHIENSGIPVNSISEWFYDKDYCTDIIREIYNLAGLEGLGISSDAEAVEIKAAGSILQYLKDTHRKTFGHLKHPKRISSSKYMVLDDATIKNLELVLNKDQSRNRTLFSVLDFTKTAMGRRTLESNLLQPLLHLEEIEKRLDIVQYFFEHTGLTNSILSELKNIHDIERLISRFALWKSFPRDYIALMQSIKAADRIRDILRNESFAPLSALSADLPDMASLSERIEKTIEDDPAISPEHGRVIKPGFNAELDHLYKLKKDAKAWILEYQEQEKSKLGIPTLKIKYNRIHGYFIEVSKGQTSKVPDDYFRKQTLVGSERYTTKELQDFESEILSSADRIVEIENFEIERLLAEVLAQKDGLQAAAAAIGEADFYCSLALSAVENKFTRPHFNSEGICSVEAGRHPVVEKYYTSEVFIPNDIMLDKSENIIKIITGPNMSGKSTYIRMAAVIQLMAQTGSFVPAKACSLSLVDRIFTRIGASDNISRGESTFLVEMNETAVILNNATDRSLIIMDEIGRGTSTYDGLSIAWAVVEYILRYLKAKTLFATHYHELTKLDSKKGIVNYNVLVKEKLNGVEFLHKVAPGAADKSYGIHVAGLAGIPKEITANAKAILEKLEKASMKSSSSQASVKKNIEKDNAREQLDMFNASNHLVIQAIKNIDPDNITPLEAINELNRLKKLIE
ncbi:MAG: DNA mismatch repair protein MutS [Spirochaetes bacterium]|nr:DNA mismatch repair protein MutS [Spirochaetota bacterium]